MIQKLKLTLLSLSAVFAFALPLAFAGAASAAVDQSTINGGLNCGANGTLEQSGCAIDTTGATKANSLVNTVINVLSLAVGIVAVIMIVVGGFRYVASGGKQESVQGAKNTILYAIIGLVIVALAQIIVHFVLNKT